MQDSESKTGRLRMPDANELAKAFALTAPPGAPANENEDPLGDYYSGSTLGCIHRWDKKPD